LGHGERSRSGLRRILLDHFRRPLDGDVRTAPPWFADEYLITVKRRIEAPGYSTTCYETNRPESKGRPMAFCPACGSPATTGARYCIECGNSVALNPKVGPSSCDVCGNEVSVGARFCSSCGNDVDHEGEIDVSSVLARLQRQLAPFGPIVLLEGSRSRRPRRLALLSDNQGLLTEGDQQGFMTFLAELLVWDGYLHGILSIGGQPASCVWHIVNGDLFPLRADHARAVLLYHEDLSMVAPTFDTIGETTDAPPISS
jgi:hypothetical protein